MLEVIISDLAADIVSIQEQIQDMLEQQRKLQAKIEHAKAAEAEAKAKLDRVRAAESKITAAIAMLTEGVAEIRDIRADELPHLEREVEDVVKTLFDGESRVIVEPTLDVTPDPQLPETVVDGYDVAVTEDGVTITPIESDIRPTPAIVWATIDELNSLPIAMIRKLATAKQVSGKGKRYEIAGRLEGKVTKTEFDGLVSLAQAS